VVVAQLGPAVEAELADDGVLERSREEVGQEVRARLLGERRADLLAGEQVVAVLTAQALHAGAGEGRVERAVGAAVAVCAREHVVALAQLVDLLAHGRRDPVGAVVQQCRDRVHRDGPSAAARDRAHVDREGPAGDDPDAAHPGKASWSMNASLKSARPESSTYSTSSRIERASARSRSDRAAIFAPSPATLPAETIRGSASLGTSPMRIALTGERYAPNEPA